MSLFTRFALILLLFALTPVVATGVWFLRSNERIEANSRHLHRQITDLSAGIVEREIFRLNRSLSFIEDFERQKRNDDVADFSILQRAAVTQPSFVLLSVLDQASRETIRVADTALFPKSNFIERRDEGVVKRARATQKISISPVSKRGNIPVIAIAHPLPRGRLLYAVYSLAGLWDRINELRVGTGGRILLLDARGAVLPGIAEGFLEPDWRGPPFEERKGWIDSVRTVDGTLVGAYTTTPSLGWRVLSLQPRSEAFATGEGFTGTALMFLLALGLLVMAATLWISGRLTKPLLKLIDAAKLASRNVFDRPVPEIGWGELSLLSHSFNQMMEKLKAFQTMQVDRMLAEKAKVEALIHTIPDGIVLADFNGKVLYMNASARSLLGSSAAQTMPSAPTSIREVFREPVLRDMARRLMRHQKKADSAELEMHDKQGRSQGFYLCRGVTVTQGGKEVGILVLLRDVTAERHLDKMKEEFFHSIVHDIRGPLGTIDGFVQIMKERKTLADKEKMYVGYIAGSCDRLRQLVNDILDSAKIESGTLKLNKKAFDMAGFFERMKTLYALQAENKKLSLGLERGPDAPAPLMVDQDLVERVVMNLVGNAMKFTPKGGNITIKTSPGKDRVRFQVSDTGRGIPKNKLETVFQKFKQLESEAATRSGYGLGLSICQKIIELHSGRIWAESEEGKGSQFIFELPLGQKAAA